MKLCELRQPGSEDIFVTEIVPIKRFGSRLILGAEMVVRRVQERQCAEISGGAYRMDYGIVKILKQIYFDKPARANSKKYDQAVQELLPKL